MSLLGIENVPITPTISLLPQYFSDL